MCLDGVLTNEAKKFTKAGKIEDNKNCVEVLALFEGPTKNTSKLIAIKHISG